MIGGRCSQFLQHMDKCKNIWNKRSKEMCEHMQHCIRESTRIQHQKWTPIRHTSWNWNQKIMKLLCLTEVQTPIPKANTHLPRNCRGLTSIGRILRFDDLFTTIHIQIEEILCMELQQAQQLCQIRINPNSCQRVIDDSLRSKLGAQT